eukprot:13265428-Alexandrium_andersonii.AAC.1
MVQACNLLSDPLEWTAAWAYYNGARPALIRTIWAAVLPTASVLYARVFQGMADTWPLKLVRLLSSDDPVVELAAREFAAV